MKTAGQHVADSPALPDPATAKLRVDLLQEELNELQQALAQGDLIEVLDALADLRVVLDGTVLACGLQHIYRKALDQVYLSNMSKFCQTEEEALDTLNAYAEKDPNQVLSMRQVGSVWVVRRASDGKILKSINYKPVDLAPLFYGTN